MKIARHDILLLVMTNPNPIARLGDYAFGHRVRYAIRFNLGTMSGEAFKTLVETIDGGKRDIFMEYGWEINPKSGNYEPPPGATNTAEVIEVVNAYLREKEEVNFRTVTFEETGDTVFPVNLMPGWMVTMEEEKEPEPATVNNGQDKELVIS